MSYRIRSKSRHGHGLQIFFEPYSLILRAKFEDQMTLGSAGVSLNYLEPVVQSIVSLTCLLRDSQIC